MPTEIRQRTPPAAPRFRVGLRLMIDAHAGVFAPGHVFTRLTPHECIVVAVRLADHTFEDWEDTGPCVYCVGTGVVDSRDADDKEDCAICDASGKGGQHLTRIEYPCGWEYYAVRVDRPSEAWGWVSEAELLHLGYEPAKVATVEADTPHLVTSRE